MISQSARQARPAGAGPPKKLVIKPLKSAPKLPADFADATWAKLKDAVVAIFNQKPVATSLEELYRAVEDMCTHKLAPLLYERLHAECDAHVAKQLAALAATPSGDGQLFLGHVERVWSSLCAQLLTVRSVFLYLDRTHVFASGAAVRSLFDMGVASFRTHLERHADVQRKTIDGMLHDIAAERGGESIDGVRLSHLTGMFATLGSYAEVFEAPFLEASARFYAHEGEATFGETDVPEYLVYAERRLREEAQRCERYLAAPTRRPLVAIVEQQLLAQHMASILARGFSVMVNESRAADLARLHSLAARVDATDALRVAWKAHLQKVGTAVVSDESKDKEMIEGVMALKSKTDHLLASAFGSNEAFVSATREAFANFLNTRQNRPAELLAKHVDGLMRSGGKGAATEEVLDAKLDAAMVIFRYLGSKDVFEAFYKTALAKRLLLGRSASVDAEKTMISKLKAECGAAYTHQMEGMFKDIDLSREILLGFKNNSSAKASTPPGMDMGVSVLTSGCWPTYPVLDVTLPSELEQCQQTFKDYYLSKHSGRRLVWYNGLGTCLVRAQFPKGAHELQVSLLQATVLMLFQEVDALPYSDIASSTGIEASELKRTLQSLACGKVRVLTKDPVGRDVHDTDTFKVNASFHSSQFRIKINTIQLKETAEETEKTNERVVQDRQHQIDAAIVRIMKTRKTLSHKLLVYELMTQLKFPVQPGDLKKRIGSLIEREYLDRDPDDASLYVYLA